MGHAHHWPLFHLERSWTAIIITHININLILHPQNGGNNDWIYKSEFISLFLLYLHRKNILRPSKIASSHVAYISETLPNSQQFSFLTLSTSLTLQSFEKACNRFINFYKSWVHYNLGTCKVFLEIRLNFVFLKFWDFEYLTQLCSSYHAFKFTIV